MEDEKSEMDKVLEILLDPKNISQLSDLNKNEILAFSILGTIARRYQPLSVLRDFLAENLVLRVSKGRGGRKEFTKIVSRQLQFSDQPQDQPPNRRGFFGLRR